MTRLVRRLVPVREGDTGPAPSPRRDRSEVLDYAETAERVTAALEVATRTAQEILTSARREADRLVAEVETVARATAAEATQRIKGIRREAERLQAEAQRHSAETREAADAYAAETRGDADKAAADALLQAEEQVRRNAAIVADAARFEDRLQTLVEVFRGMTQQLEDLLATGSERPEREVRPEDTLQESLEVQTSKAERARRRSA